MLSELLRDKKNFEEKDLPKTMKWAFYDDLCCEYGVELVGWTEPGNVCNPADLKTPALQRILNAITTGQCYWRALNDEEWVTKRSVRAEAIAGDKAKGRKAKSKSSSGRKVKSRETIEGSDEEPEGASVEAASRAGEGEGTGDCETST
ncbi:hypothetical protein EW026_g4087 [Hermanssonia centrifuga]|uniref:Uncharacterized protein n=1 Tax=Hermanssonia centrifuga TaxID=98765 RepID=A0A4S4KI82_9APHY|nr:hypothetical protein EW026_g4087 [Hermanssonia centrifuga]